MNLLIKNYLIIRDIKKIAIQISGWRTRLFWFVEKATLFIIYISIYVLGGGRYDNILEDDCLPAAFLVWSCFIDDIYYGKTEIFFC